MKTVPSKKCVTRTEIEARLVSAGIQPTAQRIAICQFVLCEADHPTAEEVKAWIDQNFTKVSLATIYNTLNILVASRLLREYRFPQTNKVVYDCNTGHHHHFIDSKTGRVFDLEPEMVKVMANLPKSMAIDSVEVWIRGTKS